ncbi:MAG TPA: glycosyltransferase [Candidatus Eisenbacteria bacterium]|nr:glycosyltransferase [Candidatus Eisenbacteria bacterium]
MHVVEAMHRGGAESLVVEHVRLAAPDVTSCVVALNRGGPALEAAAAAGATVAVLGKGGARLAGLARLTALLRARRVEVVNGHNPTGALYATLAARLAGVPVVVRTEHSVHYPGRGFALYGPVEALLTALSDRVVAVCEAVRASHASRLRWAERRFVTVLNGVAEDAAAPAREPARAALGLAPHERAVLSVGSLTPQKAQDVLLAAFATVAARVPEAVLLLAGEGRLEPELRARHAALGLGARVRFLGARDDVPALMAACDLYVLSSVREGLSVTLLEAMRAGRACVATAVGGNAEAVADGDSGRVVPARDPAALAEAVAGLLADPERLAACGAAGARRFRARFTAARMVRETEAVYRAALAGRGVRAGEAGRALA